MPARMSPVDAMPWPFSPTMPAAKSILVSCAIWFKTVLVCWQSGLKQAQAEIPPLLGFGAASRGPAFAKATAWQAEVRGQRSGMQINNDEARMTNDEGSSNAQMTKRESALT